MFEWLRDEHGINKCIQAILSLSNPDNSLEHVIKLRLHDCAFDVISHHYGKPESLDGHSFKSPSYPQS